MHNLFKGIKVNLDDTHVNQCVIEIASQCHDIITKYHANKQNIELELQTITIPELHININLEIKNNQLNIYLTESSKVFSFAATTLLLSIDLSNPNKSNKN